MKITKKQIVWFSILIFFIVAAIIIYYIGRNNGWFALFESKENVQEYVSSFGALAPFAFFLLQFIQVILSPIPGSITTLAGGLMFGFFYAFIISTAAVDRKSVV